MINPMEAVAGCIKQKLSFFRQRKLVPKALFSVHFSTAWEQSINNDHIPTDTPFVIILFFAFLLGPYACCGGYVD
jgi:hypothetical protein